MKHYGHEKSIFFGIVAVAAAFFAYPAFSDNDDAIKVIAVVNDQIVSSVDLGDRIKIIMATTGIADTPENRAKLAPQILHQLVDERLQVQDAAKNSIVISDEKVNETIARIEKQNGKAPGSLVQFFDLKGAPKASFLAQIRAQEAWAQIVMKKIRPGIRVSDQELSLYSKRKSLSGKSAKEVMIATILLPVDSPANEPAVFKAATKLADEIHSGASFEAVSTQFSSGARGAKKTEAFWVDIGQLDPAIGMAIAKVSKGGVTQPVKTESGYQIVKLVDMRQKDDKDDMVLQDSAPKQRAELAFKQIVISPKEMSKAGYAASVRAAKDVAKLPGICSAKTISADKDADKVDLKVSLVRRMSDALPDEVRNILSKLAVGSVSAPVATARDVRVFALCERAVLPPEKPSAAAPAVNVSDEAVRQSIYEEKLELGAQKYLRNLRREAFIEVHNF